MGGENIGGLSRAVARGRIAARVGQVTGQPVTLAAGGGRREVTLAALGVDADVEATLQAATAIGRSGSLPQRITTVLRAHRAGIVISPKLRFTESRTQALVSALAQQINVPPSDAAATWDAGKVRITPERRGAKLDEPASRKQIVAYAQTVLRTGDSGAARRLDLPYREKVPRVTAEALGAVDTVLGELTTSFTTSSSNRATNVTTAAKAINGTVLMPGETFSFNKVVGPRDADNGFRTAPVIVNGQLTPGMGGGICQVSSTLYNAVLRANLQIVSRSHHSLPVHYVPPGLDATVSYGAIDFRFRNASATPVVIETVIRGRTITARVLGQGPAPIVKLERSGIAALGGRTVTYKDKTLPYGMRVVAKKGSNGIAVTVTRIVGEGDTAKREVISRDKYLGEATVVRVGTGAVAAPAPPDAASAPGVPAAGAD